MLQGLGNWQWARAEPCMVIHTWNSMNWGVIIKMVINHSLRFVRVICTVASRGLVVEKTVFTCFDNFVS